MAWLKSYLSNNKPDSSLRLNLLIITIPTAILLLTLTVHIIWVTFNPVYIIGVSGGKTEYITREIHWMEIATFVGALGVFVFQLWYGKKLNKDSENNAEAPK